MNAKKRCKQRRIERRKLEREQLATESRLEQRIESIMTGCSGRVSKALNGTLTLRDRSSEPGSQCLPEVGIFFAGHRKSVSVSAR
ncbi:transcriptional regulator [Rosenbergiella collisarenosi]|uniref:transcriptional antitermination N peptide n=1 Tax=Rosenbergiella collisarenosi TaxID=1544695 RepID=UPI001BDA182C|nr:transcriptional regulator [Rosenbergiella collisarenosi]MBT0720415.1 transcriptional regulator [Rosenbergiella collisarenosi]